MRDVDFDRLDPEAAVANAASFSVFAFQRRLAGEVAALTGLPTSA
jgi:hypothetical protein